MKTFKIRYEFFNRSSQPSFWDIGSAIVIAEDDYQASEMFYTEVMDQSATVISNEEINTKQIVWAY